MQSSPQFVGPNPHFTKPPTVTIPSRSSQISLFWCVLSLCRYNYGVMLPCKHWEQKASHFFVWVTLLTCVGNFPPSSTSWVFSYMTGAQTLELMYEPRCECVTARMIWVEGGREFRWPVSWGMSPVVLLFETVESAGMADLSPLVTWIIVSRCSIVPNTEHLAYCGNYARAASERKSVPLSAALSHARQDKASTLACHFGKLT